MQDESGEPAGIWRIQNPKEILGVMGEKPRGVTQLHLLVLGIKIYLNDFVDGERDKEEERRNGGMDGEKLSGWMDGWMDG